ncbi:tetratricopeptide repeat protein [Oxalobacteraceae bacterium A2-2]
MMKRLHSAALMLCLGLAGCATRPAAPVADAPIPAKMEELGALAEQAIAAGDLTSAGRLYVRLVTAYPDSAPGWYRLGTVYLRTNQPAYAQRAFEQALALDPSLQKAYANLALAHLAQFGDAARRAVASGQVSADNRRALTSLLQDVEQTMPSPAALARPQAAAAPGPAPAPPVTAPVPPAVAAAPAARASAAPVTLRPPVAAGGTAADSPAPVAAGSASAPATASASASAPTAAQIQPAPATAPASAVPGASTATASAASSRPPVENP